MGSVVVGGERMFNYISDVILPVYDAAFNLMCESLGWDDRIAPEREQREGIKQTMQEKERSPVLPSPPLTSISGDSKACEF